MAVLAMGVGGAKLLAFLATPLLTRLFDPAEFGVLSVFTAYVLIISPFCSLRYAAALPLPKSDAAALNLAALTALLIMLLSTIVVVVLILFDWIVPEIGFHSISEYWIGLWIALILYGLFELAVAWGIRKRLFGGISKATFLQAVFGEGAKLASGLFKLGGGGLILGYVLGLLVAVSTFAYMLWKTSPQWRSISRARVALVWKKYKEFPLYRMPSQIFLVVASQTPILALASLSGSAAAGQLGLAMTVIAVPMTLLGQTTSQAYYSEIAKLGASKASTIYDLTKYVTLRLFAVSLLPFLILLFGGEWGFSKLFGSHWSQAGKFASSLSVYLVLQFVAAPLVNVLNVFGQHGKFLRINLVRAVLVVGVFLVAWRLDISAEKSILAYGTVLSAHYLVFLVSTFLFLRRAAR